MDLQFYGGSIHGADDYPGFGIFLNGDAFKILGDVEGTVEKILPDIKVKQVILKYAYNESYKYNGIFLSYDGLLYSWDDNDELNQYPDINNIKELYG